MYWLKIVGQIDWDEISFYQENLFDFLLSTIHVPDNADMASGSEKFTH